MSRLPSPRGPALPLLLPGWRSDLLRLAKVIWPFLLTMPLLVGIAVESFGLQTAGRAFVTGESLWSKAQKDAIQALARYSLTCDRHALADYEHARRDALVSAYPAFRDRILSLTSDALSEELPG